LSPNDFFIHWLTGRFVTDTFNALKCQATLEPFAYPITLMKELGLDPAKFPGVEKPGTMVGNLLGTRAKELGLSADTRVVLATYDAICAFWGSGASETGDACDVSGTVTSLRVLTPFKKDREAKALYLLPSLIGDWEIVGGSNNLGGGLIEWTKQTFYPDDSHPYETMEMEARQSPLGARGLIFLPYLLGERAPLWDENIRGCFFGVERAHKRSDFARAIFESAGFSLLWLLQEIEASDVEISKIKASGGVTQIPFISQLKADILGKEIHVVDVFESTSLGAFFYAKAQHDSSQMLDLVRSCVNVREIIKPQMSRHEKYKKLFAFYQNLYRTLKPFALERKSLLKEMGFDKLESIENL
jgi:xylulokinase